MSNSKSIIAACGLLLATLCATAQAATWEEIREKGVLSVAVYRDYVPFSYKDGNTTRGIDVEVARAIAGKLGLSLALVPFTADESLEDDLRNMVWKGHYLGIGPADVMMHVPVDRGLQEDNDRATIFGAYFQARLAVVFDPEQVSAVADLTALDQLQVGVETDQLADHYLTAVYGGRYRDNVVHFMQVEQAAEALRAKQIQAFMGPLSHIEGALGAENANYRTAYPALRGLAIDRWNVGVAAKADNPELVRQVDAALAALLADGTIAKIFAAHHVTHRPPE